MDSETKALRKTGYEVELFAARTDELEGDRLYPMKAALRVATGRGRSPLDAINAFRPDIVHIHNLFPNFGRRWVEDLDVPVVHTLHNFRPLCANALLLRDGHICTDCPDGKRWSGVRHACYRNSRLATLPLAWANRNGPMADPLISRAERLIVLSERQRSIYSSVGVPEEKMIVWPNFLPDELDPGPLSQVRREGWLFVGRLSSEKGILQLIERWPKEHRLRIVGDGPQRREVEVAAAKRSIEVLGRTPRENVMSLMKHSLGLLIPSLGHESFVLVYLEALASGLPTVAFEPNTVCDFVRRDRTGWVIEWAEDLSIFLSRVANDTESLRTLCRSTFERIGTSASYEKRALALYSDILN